MKNLEVLISNVLWKNFFRHCHYCKTNYHSLFGWIFLYCFSNIATIYNYCFFFYFSRLILKLDILEGFKLGIIYLSILHAGVSLFVLLRKKLHCCVKERIWDLQDWIWLSFWMCLKVFLWEMQCTLIWMDLFEYVWPLKLFRC